MSASDRFKDKHLRYRLVDDERSLRELRSLLELRQQSGQLEQVSVDFEFAGLDEHSFSLRLVQLGLEQSNAFAEQQCLIDASKVDVRPLAALFSDPSVEKLLHAPLGDYQRWLEHNGADSDEAAERYRFQNVYDSAQHIGLIHHGLRQLNDARTDQVLAWSAKKSLRPNYYGYAAALGSLAESMVGVEWSDKRLHWSSNWMPDELPERQLEAAALDVAILPHIKTKLAPLEADLLRLGVDVGAEADRLDQRLFNDARDLVLVPGQRRDELLGLFGDFALQAARGDGRLFLPALSPAEQRFLLREKSEPRPLGLAVRVTASLNVDAGRLVVRALTKERIRELSMLAEQIRRQDEPRLPKLEPMEEQLVTRYITNRYPDVTLALDPS